MLKSYGNISDPTYLECAQVGSYFVATALTSQMHRTGFPVMAVAVGGVQTFVDEASISMILQMYPFLLVEEKENGQQKADVKIWGAGKPELSCQRRKNWMTVK